MTRQRERQIIVDSDAFGAAEIRQTNRVRNSAIRGIIHPSTFSSPVIFTAIILAALVLLISTEGGSSSE